MKTLKKVAPYLLIALFAATALTAFAQPNPGTIPDPGFQGDIGDDSSYTSVGGWVDVLLTVVQWIYTILFIVAVLFILLAAYNFVTSKGDPAKTKSAKQQLLYAVIGIAVGLLSYTVVELVRNSLESGL